MRSLRSSRLAPVAAVFACALSQASAFADGRDPAAAEALFRDGRAAAQRGEWEVACPKLRESQRLDPAAGTLLNLADCEQHRGKVATAWQLFRQVIESLPASDERVPIASQRASALEKRLPHLTVRLSNGAPPGAKVTRSDVELSEASLGSALPVDPGTYTITVTAPGRSTTATQAVVVEAASVTVEVSAGAPATAGPLMTPSDKPSNGARTAGWVMGGIGVVGLGVGTLTGILTLADKRTVDDHCNGDTKRCDQAGYDAAQSGKSLGIVTTAALVTGVLGVGAGAYLLFTAGDRESSRTAITVGRMGDGAGLSLRGRW